jgi:hypothetical protein
MSRSVSRLALPALLASALAGCADQDACKGRSETCLSLTLSGEGVMEADQLEVMVQRLPKPQSPMMPLGEARPLPFKVAVLWPDGPGTLSVRSYLAGTLNGVSSELTLDLRNGEHDMRKLTLYPPLDGRPIDFGTPPRRDMARPVDMTMPPPPDMSMPPSDMSVPPPDFSVPPPDFSVPPPDFSMPTD